MPVDGPVRTCVGCRVRGPRSSLLRVVVATDDAGSPVLVLDVRRRMPGRGAWVHPDLHCLELAVRRRAFPRALRYAGPLDVAALTEAVAAADGENPDPPQHGPAHTAGPHVEKEAGWKPMAAR